MVTFKTIKDTFKFIGNCYFFEHAKEFEDATSMKKLEDNIREFLTCFDFLKDEQVTSIIRVIRRSLKGKIHHPKRVEPYIIFEYGLFIGLNFNFNEVIKVAKPIQKTYPADTDYETSFLYILIYLCYIFFGTILLTSIV